MGVARTYAALARGPVTIGVGRSIEAEFRRTVAMLGRVTGTGTAARRRAGPPAVRRAAQPLRRFAVGAAGAAAGPAAAPRGRRSRARPRPAAGPVDRERRRGRAAEHGIGRGPRRPRARCCGAAVEPGGTWADIGAGSGAFTLALADLVGPGGRIVAVDRDAGALRQMEEAVTAGIPATCAVEAVVADFRRPLSLPALDGLVAANSLHFVARDRAGRSRPSARGVLAAGRTVRRRGVRRRPWQPVGAAPVQLSAGGCDWPMPRAWWTCEEIGRVPSRFLGAIYSAVARRRWLSPLARSGGHGAR